MITLNLPIYKVVTRYTCNGKSEVAQAYFLDYYKALAYAEEDSKFAYVALNELEEGEGGRLRSCKCIKIW